ncbi:uncharacterized protein LOC117207888 isoform X1 [Bombus bifarius]|uniref:Uncharacterized protein LOC117207888 isoform X1 n=1 Tax=Bombus bifarius TaxID=103933 RepID=A0A6P8LU17_9HYME|nr:uncharacterized protein LOC117207888 isoform X1 [Bombus bifarius]
MKKGKKLKKKAARSARRTKTNSRIKALQRRRKKCEEGVTRRGGTRWPHLNHHCTRMASFIRKFKVRSREAVLRSIPFVRSIILYNRRLLFPFESTSVDSDMRDEVWWKIMFDQVYDRNDGRQRRGLFNGTYEKESAHPRILSDGHYNGRL